MGDEENTGTDAEPVQSGAEPQPEPVQQDTPAETPQVESD